MANTIKIKRGTGTSALADGELGFNTSTNILYIGNGGSNKIIGGPGVFLPTTGGNVTGYLNFGTTNQGLKWETANGAAIHLRPYSPSNVFQITIQNSSAGVSEYGALNINTESGELSLSKPLGIASGGTAATSADGACTNLGAVKKSGDTISGNLKTSKTSLGYYLTDGAGNQYPAAYDNGSNLWIGSVATSATHHKGETYISAGHNGTSGNSTIKVCVPNAANNGGTSYSVLHSGNYSGYASFTTPLTVKNGSYAGKVELHTNSEGGNIILGSKSGTYLYQWDAYQDNYIRFFVQNTAGTVLNGAWTYNADTGSFTTKILNIGSTTDITGIVYSSSQPTGTTGKIWLKPI